MSHNDETPEHGDIEHYDDDEVNPNVDVEDEDQAEGSECNITSDDLDQIAVGWTKIESGRHYQGDLRRGGH